MSSITDPNAASAGGDKSDVQAPVTDSSKSESDALTGACARPQASSSKPMTWQEKLSSAQQYKAEGNEKYKGQMYKLAIGKYHRALLFLKGIEDSQNAAFAHLGQTAVKLPNEAKQTVEKLKVDCYNNLAACLLQQTSPNYQKIAKYCDEVLQTMPNNTKALYRRGVSLYHLKDVDGALIALKRATQQEQGQKDPNVRRYIGLCEKEQVRQDQKLKKTYQGMFNKMAAGDRAEDKEDNKMAAGDRAEDKEDNKMAAGDRAEDKEDAV